MLQSFDSISAALVVDPYMWEIWPIHQQLSDFAILLFAFYHKVFANGSRIGSIKRERQILLKAVKHSL